MGESHTQSMNRDKFEEKAAEYANSVPESYPEISITSDHFYVEVTAKQTSILGNAKTVDGSPYTQARLGLSWHAYRNRNRPWDRLKETIRHEICHIDNWFVHGHMGHGPTFRDLARSVDIENLTRYDGKNDPRYQYVRDMDGVASWNHYNCKRIRRKRNDHRYTVFRSDQYDIREMSDDWRDSRLTAGLRDTGPTALDTGQVRAEADDE